MIKEGFGFVIVVIGGIIIGMPITNPFEPPMYLMKWIPVIIGTLIAAGGIGVMTIGEKSNRPRKGDV